MGMKIFGLDKVVAFLRNVAEKVPDHARRTMHQSADKIVERAQLMCPVDTHALEQSIHKEVGYGARRRLEINIVAGAGLDYAEQVHENYDDSSPGPGTKAKQAANPDVHIGRHFLTRALDEQRPRMSQKMIEAVHAGVVEADR